MSSYLASSRARHTTRVGWYRDTTGELPNLVPVGSFLHGHGVMYTTSPIATARSCSTVGTWVSSPAKLQVALPRRSFLPL